MKKILVVGHYGKQNLGDDLFIEAFQSLFPDYQFSFTEEIITTRLAGVNAVFFGGGSFLGQPPLVEPNALPILRFLPLFYLGVGVEDFVHPEHLSLMSFARLIATRSPEQVAKLQGLGCPVLSIPDLVYSLQDQVKLRDKKPRSVLVMPNSLIVPQYSDPHWKHAAWGYFKSEFAQFMDMLVNNNWQPTFFPMCQGDQLDDGWASAELVSHMKYRSVSFLTSPPPLDFSTIAGFVSGFEMVITQRFHGIVLAEMTKTPYLSIHHHDKLKQTQPFHGASLSYYQASKKGLTDGFHAAQQSIFPSLPIETNIYEALVERVNELI